MSFALNNYHTTFFSSDTIAFEIIPQWSIGQNWQISWFAAIENVLFKLPEGNCVPWALGCWFKWYIVWVDDKDPNPLLINQRSTNIRINFQRGVATPGIKLPFSVRPPLMAWFHLAAAATPAAEWLMTMYGADRWRSWYFAPSRMAEQRGLQWVTCCIIHLATAEYDTAL